jgi:hypothetical protein
MDHEELLFASSVMAMWNKYNSSLEGEFKVAQGRPGFRRQRRDHNRVDPCHKTCLDESGPFKGLKTELYVQSPLRYMRKNEGCIAV